MRVRHARLFILMKRLGLTLMRVRHARLPGSAAGGGRANHGKRGTARHTRLARGGVTREADPAGLMRVRHGESGARADAQKAADERGARGMREGREG